MIWVTPLSGLEQTWHRSGARHLISLLSAGAEFTAPAAVAPDQLLRLSMHDIAQERDGFVAPSVEHMRKILDFGRRWYRSASTEQFQARRNPLCLELHKDEPSELDADSPKPQYALVVHCYAGISRSTAAAFALAAALQPERDEVELAWELRRLAPSATPNPLLIAHADFLLGRNGRMSRAIERIGRGAEAREGIPFRLEFG